jgi:hypothetical protein
MNEIVADTDVRPVPAQEKCPGAGDVSMLGCGLAQPTSSDIRLFVPRLDNYYERRLYRQARKVKAFDRLTVGALRTVAEGPRRRKQARLAALEVALEEAMTSAGMLRMSRKTSNRIGMIYLDFFGPVSSLRQTPTKDEGFLLDTYPTTLLKQYMIKGYSIRMRGDRTIALQAIALARDLLRYGVLDFVIIGGLYQAVPALVLTDAVDQCKWEGRYFGRGRAAPSASLVMERCIFVVLGHGDAGSAIRLGVPAYHRLPPESKEAGDRWRAQWAATIGDTVPDEIFAGMGGLGGDGRMELSALSGHFPNTPITQVISTFGDSGGLNPLLALRHLASRPHHLDRDKTYLLNGFDRNRDSWCVRIDQQLAVADRGTKGDRERRDVQKAEHLA